MYDLDHTVEPIILKCITEPFYEEHMRVFFSVTCHSVTQAHVSLLKTFGKNSVSNINFDDMLAIFLKWPRAKVLVKM